MRLLVLIGGFLGPFPSVVGAAPERTIGGLRALPAAPRPHVRRVMTWRGIGPNRDWTTPSNWDRGVVPGPLDAARFDGRSTGTVLDEAASGLLGAVILEEGFTGTIRLGRDLSVTGSLVIAGGSFVQGPHSLSAGRLEQTGGRLAGGTRTLEVSGAAAVSGGILETPRGVTRIRTLELRAPGIVRVGEKGRLELTGDGAPLLGDGHLDTTTNRPTSVEFTGRTTMEVPLAGAGARFRPPGRQKGIEAQSQTGSRAAFARGRSPLAYGDAETMLPLYSGEYGASASLVDAAAGFAYFAFLGYPAAEIVKIRLSDLTRVGTLTLASGESEIGSAVIDVTGGFAYFTADGPLTASAGSIVKIRLSDFSRVGALALNPNENGINASVIDPAAGFAYFATNTMPALAVKVRLSDFTRADALELGGGRPSSLTAMIDLARGLAYFVSPWEISKVRLSDFSRVGDLFPDPASGQVSSAAIDPGGDFAYLATTTSPGTIVKVRLSDLTVTDRITMEPTEVGFVASAVDPAGEYAYFGMRSSPGVVVRVRLSDFTRLDALALGAEESYLSTMVLDPTRGNLVISAQGPPGKIVRVGLSDFLRIDALTLRSGENKALSSVIDPSAGYAYFGTYTSPGFIVKVRLSDFKRVGALTLAPGEDGLTSAAIDPASGFAYFGTYTDPGIVVKVRLSDFTRVGGTAMGSAESYFITASIDASGDFAYFGTDTTYLPPGSPGLLVKVRLSDLTKVGSLDVTGGAGSVYCSVVDTPGGYAYVGTDTLATLLTVARVRLSDFTLAGILPLPDVGFFLSSAVIDQAAGFVYVTGGPAKIAKIRLSDFTRAGTLVLPSEGGALSTAVIDPASGFAYFGSDARFPFAQPNTMSRVVRVRLSDFMPTGTLILRTTNLSTAVIDPSTRFAYFGTDTHPAMINRVDVSTLTTPTATVSGGIDGLTLCPSGFIIHAHLTGMPPWSVSWSDGVAYSGMTWSPHVRQVSPTLTTTYSVTSVSDANGPGSSTGSATFTLFPPTPAPTITAPAYAFPGASGLTASVPYHVGSRYSWSVNGGVSTSSLTSDQITFSAALAGSIVLYAAESAPCQSPSSVITIPVVTATPPLTLHTLPPCRLFDTRENSGPDSASPILGASTKRVFDANGRCGIPPSAIAISANVTVTQPGSGGELVLSAGNEPSPSTSTISFAAGQTRASSVIVRLGSDGSGTIAVQNNSAGTVHFILDVNGYFE